MKVRIYVEGTSEREALRRLLAPIVVDHGQPGVTVQWFPQDGKAQILNRVPRMAADLLKDAPEDWVIALPDLHPMSPYRGTVNEHSSFAQLRALMERKFVARADEVGLRNVCRRRFRVHCLKHDLEALVLAAPDALRDRLGTPHRLEEGWRRPVETQNGERPPKYVVDGLFKQYRSRAYEETQDAPWILDRANLGDVERACPQQFAPFVAELRAIVFSGGDGLT